MKTKRKALSYYHNGFDAIHALTYIPYIHIYVCIWVCVYVSVSKR